MAINASFLENSIVLIFSCLKQIAQCNWSLSESTGNIDDKLINGSILPYNLRILSTSLIGARKSKMFLVTELLIIKLCFVKTKMFSKRIQFNFYIFKF